MLENTVTCLTKTDEYLAAAQQYRRGRTRQGIATCLS
jgi:hypothetical protein